LFFSVNRKKNIRNKNKKNGGEGEGKKGGRDGQKGRERWVFYDFPHQP
jgi:hypothetical protein